MPRGKMRDREQAVEHPAITLDAGHARLTSSRQAGSCTPWSLRRPDRYRGTPRQSSRSGAVSGPPASPVFTVPSGSISST